MFFGSHLSAHQEQSFTEKYVSEIETIPPLIKILIERVIITQVGFEVYLCYKK